MLKVSICMPTRGRTEQALRAIDNVFETTQGHDIEMIVVSHPDEELLRQFPRAKYLESELKLRFRECTAIEGWNIAASEASGDWLKVWDDDLIAQPGWLDEVEKTWIEFHRPKTAYIGLWDRHADVPDRLFTRAIGTRRFFVEHCGGVLTIPAYKSWYDDTEKFDIAKAANCAIYCPSAIIEHRHPAYGYASDATYELGNTRHHGDASTFARRKAEGFPKDYAAVIK